MSDGPVPLTEDEFAKLQGTWRERLSSLARLLVRYNPTLNVTPILHAAEVLDRLEDVLRRIKEPAPCGEDHEWYEWLAQEGLDLIK